MNLRYLSLFSGIEAATVAWKSLGWEEQMETKGEYIVRRITPTECERLQGFPDGYTDIPWPNAEHAPDSHRYKALGNSFCVPVVRWIGERIEYALSHPITEDKSDKIPWQPELF